MAGAASSPSEGHNRGPTELGAPPLDPILPVPPSQAPTTATLAEVKRPGLLFRALPSGLSPVKTAIAWRKDNVTPIVANFLGRFS